MAGATGGRATPESPEWLLPVPPQPVPVLILHGLADEAVPFAGGRPARGGAREYPSAEEAFAFWATAGRCVNEPLRTVSFSGAVTEESCTDAAGYNEVRLVRLADWGHEWPGGTLTTDLPGNHPLKGFDAATFIWRFLRRFPAD
jgi:polyhydroxybutyrate depolymerase